MKKVKESRVSIKAYLALALPTVAASFILQRSEGHRSCMPSPRQMDSVQAASLGLPKTSREARAGAPCSSSSFVLGGLSDLGLFADLQCRLRERPAPAAWLPVASEGQVVRRRMAPTKTVRHLHNAFAGNMDKPNAWCSQVCGFICPAIRQQQSALIRKPQSDLPCGRDAYIQTRPWSTSLLSE